MLRISKLTDYAVIVLGYMAQHTEKTYATTELADATGIPEPTVGKVLKLLAKSAILRSVRGAKGGYGLMQPPELISVARIIKAMEGPIALTDCEGEHGGCNQSTSCSARGSWGVINLAVRTALESVSLADMSRPRSMGQEEFFIPVSSLHLNR